MYRSFVIISLEFNLLHSQAGLLQSLLLGGCGILHWYLSNRQTNWTVQVHACRFLLFLDCFLERLGLNSRRIASAEGLSHDVVTFPLPVEVPALLSSKFLQSRSSRKHPVARFARLSKPKLRKEWSVYVQIELTNLTQSNLYFKTAKTRNGIGCFSRLSRLPLYSMAPPGDWWRS